MIVLPDDRAAFVHIPKTGGEWVSGVLRDEIPGSDFETRTDGQWQKHTPPNRPGCVNKPKFYFTFLRHPVSWVESWWMYQSRADWGDWDVGHWHPFRELQDCQHRDFNGSVRILLDRHPGFVSRLYRLYCGNDGELIDYIGRTETLRHDLETVLRNLHYDCNWDRIRSAPRSNSAPNVVRPTWDGVLLTKYTESESILSAPWFGGKR